MVTLTLEPPLEARKTGVRQRQTARRAELARVIELGAAAVRRNPCLYGEMLAMAVGALRDISSLTTADMLAMLLLVIDRFASEMIAGEIDAGRGRGMAAALAGGQFDAYLLPESRAQALQAIGAAPP